MRLYMANTAYNNINKICVNQIVLHLQVFPFLTGKHLPDVSHTGIHFSFFSDNSDIFVRHFKSKFNKSDTES